jgi:hypothetical protein
MAMTLILVLLFIIISISPVSIDKPIASLIYASKYIPDQKEGILF